MGDAKWTKEQLAAITAKDCNLLVAAAAGAGKTAVLVERIIRKITCGENPVDIDRLLIVTFTNAAATEMRERIGQAIAKAIEKASESSSGQNLQKQLQRQLTLLNKASITTIHSFCLDVIKNNFQYIDLDPNFRIADDTEAVLMKIEALEELFEEMYEEGPVEEDFFELVECYGGGRDDRQLQETVLTLYEFVQSYPWPEKWLCEKSEAFNIDEDSDFGSTVWAGILLKSIRIELEGLVRMMQGAVNAIRASEGLEPYLPNFQEELSCLSVLLNECKTDGILSWDKLYNAFSSIEFGKLTRCGKDVNKEKQEFVKGIRDEVKKRVRKICDDVFTACSRDTIADLKHMYPLVKCLSQLVMEFGRRYSQKKRQKSLLDFNDLEHFCLEILTDGETEGDSSQLLYVKPSKVACGYRERFDEILVDEYQDSNLVQEVMLNAISRCDGGIPNIFMVGDVKQSIYRFRQAKPELFLQKYNSYSGNEGEMYRKVLLYKNFRSRAEVIDSVNFVFKQIMSVDVGELDYTDEEALNLGASFADPCDEMVLAGGAAEVHIIDVSSGAQPGEGVELQEKYVPQEEEPGTEGDDPEEEPPDNIQCEARIIIKRIKELMVPDEEGRSYKIYDKAEGGYRQVEYRDIVILLRATRNWADIFVEELGAQGIPAYADSGTGYFKTIEVQVMMSLLQIIDNPLQDIPLLAVLRSPIAEFTPEELIDIRLTDREIPIYAAMKKLAAEGENRVAEKAAKFVESLEKWRDKARYLSTDELIWHLYTDTGYYSYTGAMPGGVQRQANLRILFERARQYEETSYKGLFNFINFINKLKSSSGDMGSAKILGESENVVRIMSIHKSKGLEFPVVIVAGCGKGFNLMDLNRNMLLHQDLGFGPDYVDSRKRLSYPTVPKQALRYKSRLESLSEEMRILYVAFTRAREKLIITGAVKGAAKAAVRWSSCLGEKSISLPQYEMLKAKNYLDWIGTSIIRHKDCKPLRELAGINEDGGIHIFEDNSRWMVRIWDKSDILAGRIKAEREEKDLIDWIKALESGSSMTEFAEEISKRLDWEYPYKKASKIPAKVSVTELKKRLDTEAAGEYAAASAYAPVLVKKPLFMEESKGLNAAEKGTVLHFVMQHLDLKEIGDTGDIRKQVEGMVEHELLTVQQAKTVDIGKIYRFLNSPLGARMKNSAVIRREVPFNIEVECIEIYGELSEELCDGETVLMQGVIDCWFEEEDGIVLLDYKSDYVPVGGTLALKEKFATQIGYYTRALERLTGKRVKERYVYLFWNSEVISYA